jgi:hypothetical protein
VYLKDSFTPALDEKIIVLYKVSITVATSCVFPVHQELDLSADCCKILQAFGSEGRLVVNYSVNPAWG